MRYGIGITTRNRPEVLQIALEQHLKFAPPDSQFVIVDDNSSVDNHVIANEFLQKTNSHFRYANTRLGIAKAKNACLTQIADCDHIFLFDDDAWPKTDGWAESWATASEQDQIGHSMFIDTIPDHSITIGDQQYQGVTISKIGTFKSFTSWSNCMGVVLHFSHQCIAALGGYDQERAINVYGYEHAQMSHRAAKAGFTQGIQYLSPSNCTDIIYSFDISYGWKHEMPSTDYPIPTSATSSVTPEEASKHFLNADLMYIEDAHIPLVDPL